MEMEIIDEKFNIHHANCKLSLFFLIIPFIYSWEKYI